MIDVRYRVRVRLVCWLAFLVSCLGGGQYGRAQSEGPVPPSLVQHDRRLCNEDSSAKNLDVRGLALVYCATAPGVTVPLRGAHATARPVFYGAVPAAWIGAGVLHQQRVAAAAYRLTLTHGATYGLVTGIKHAVRRPRPYVTHPVAPRAKRHEDPTNEDAYLSFPSGHASLSTALVTSWSLSYPRWYVVAPGILWATGVTLSRLHLGVHYPSDVLTGTLVGIGMAVLVHHFRRAVTPAFLRPASRGTQRPKPTLPVVLRVRF